MTTTGPDNLDTAGIKGWRDDVRTNANTNTTATGTAPRARAMTDLRNVAIALRYTG